MEEIKDYLVYKEGVPTILSDFRVGIEVEFTGISKFVLAEHLVSVGKFKEKRVESRVVNGATRVKIRLFDHHDRSWLLLVDRSITPMSKDGTNVEEDIDFMCELVSPILQSSEDFLFFFSVIDEIRELGGLVNNSCGLHMHLDAPTNVDVLKNVFSRFITNQEIYKESLKVPECRLKKYIKLYSESFIHSYNDIEPNINSVSDLQDFIYNSLGEGYPRGYEKNPARYYMLNLDSIHKRGTIEFRLFNSTLNTNIINKYLGWVHSFMCECMV